jgi:hypothetical protein
MHLLPPQVELDSNLLILTLATLAIGYLDCSLLDRLQSTRSPRTLARARRCASATEVDGVDVPITGRCLRNGSRFQGHHLASSD